jgi:hypothetical protein
LDFQKDAKVVSKVFEEHKKYGHIFSYLVKTLWMHDRK